MKSCVELVEANSKTPTNKLFQEVVDKVARPRFAEWLGVVYKQLVYMNLKSETMTKSDLFSVATSVLPFYLTDINFEDGSLYQRKIAAGTISEIKPPRKTESSKITANSFDKKDIPYN